MSNALEFDRVARDFVTPNGQIIPFDTYNLFYRDGRIAGIRAARRST